MCDVLHRLTRGRSGGSSPIATPFVGFIVVLLLAEWRGTTLLTNQFTLLLANRYSQPGEYLKCSGARWCDRLERGVGAGASRMDNELAQLSGTRELTSGGNPLGG